MCTNISKKDISWIDEAIEYCFNNRLLKRVRLPATKVVSSNPVHGKMYSIQHYVIKFVTDLRQVGCFFPCTLVSSTNKTDRHDIAEILLNVALNSIDLPTESTANYVLEMSSKGHVCGDHMLTLYFYGNYISRSLFVLLLSVPLRYTDSDYPFGIFKLFFLNIKLI